MNNFIMALVLVLGSSSLQAEPFTSEGNMARILAQASNTAVHKVIDKQTIPDEWSGDYFKSAIKTSTFLPMRLMLEITVPQTTKTLEFAGLFHEIYETNRRMALLVEQIEKTNIEDAV